MPKTQTPNNFTQELMIAKCITRFCLNVVSDNLYGLEVTKEKIYKYYLSENEISFLGQIDEKYKDFYFESRFISAPYDFKLSNNQAKYSGVIKIQTTFIEGASLEDSYFIISLKFIEETKLEINLAFDEHKIEQIFEEFVDNIWNSVFNKLGIKGIEASTSLSNNSPRAVIFDKKDIETQKIDYKPAFLDIFNIVMSVFIDVLPNRLIEISASDIQNYRNIKTNNAKQLVLIKEALYFIKNLGLIDIKERGNYKYALTLLKLPSASYYLSKKLIEYNPKTQITEKLIGEFIYYRAYIEKKMNLKIKCCSIVDLIKSQTTSLRPSVIRNNIEKALDTLENDNVINAWEYVKFAEIDISGKSTLEKYKKLSIKIKL
ncbi:MAG: hypothetical protein PHV37_02055 [Candidatus Gastranaerophilales bacterium]|nr:hypothetical protein [Candidatus Gastranaerophilales bacterium]